VQALRYERYGGPEVVGLQEVPTPTPRAGECLVRVHAAALNPKDSFFRIGEPKFVRPLAGTLPRGIGFDFAGEVVGTSEPVYGLTSGLRGSTCAEYVQVPLRMLAPKPKNLSFAQAAALPLVMLTALQALRDDGGLKAQGSVLVYGASGGVGTAALQIAKALGAKTIVSVSSAKNRELCLSLGATLSLDYASDHLPPPGLHFDVIFDTIGEQTFGRWRTALLPGGMFVGTRPTPSLLAAIVSTRLFSRRARLVAVRSDGEDLRTLTRFVEAGLVAPVIDSVFAMSAAQEAFTRLDSHRARGKVVIQVSPPGRPEN
jgi:NADPH:quinone reductase-like Zn-dependent oxidoreductase